MQVRKMRAAALDLKREASAAKERATLKAESAANARQKAAIAFAQVQLLVHERRHTEAAELEQQAKNHLATAAKDEAEADADLAVSAAHEQTAARADAQLEVHMKHAALLEDRYQRQKSEEENALNVRFWWHVLLQSG